MEDVAEFWGLPDAGTSSDLVAATDLLVKHIKADRIGAVLNRRAPGLGNSSLIELAASGDTAAVLTAVRSMFDIEQVVR